MQLHNYASQIRTLGIVWYIYAGLSMLFGTLGLAFANAFLANHFGPWSHGPWAHNNWPLEHGGMALFFLRFAWVAIFARSLTAFAAGYVLYNRLHWGRPVAIVAAVINLLHFPLGTAMGIWTLVMVLGYRNSTLYDQLSQA
jgi:hypothetical protein